MCWFCFCWRRGTSFSRPSRAPRGAPKRTSWAGIRGRYPCWYPRNRAFAGWLPALGYQAGYHPNPQMPRHHTVPGWYARRWYASRYAKKPPKIVNTPRLTCRGSRRSQKGSSAQWKARLELRKFNITQRTFAPNGRSVLQLVPKSARPKTHARQEHIEQAAQPFAFGLAGFSPSTVKYGHAPRVRVGGEVEFVGLGHVLRLMRHRQLRFQWGKWKHTFYFAQRMRSSESWHFCCTAAARVGAGRSLNRSATTTDA